MREIKKHHTEVGYTLVEVLAAITLLSIVIVIFTGMIAQSSSFTSKNTEKIEALNLARKTLTLLRNEKGIDLTKCKNTIDGEDDLSCFQELSNQKFYPYVKINDFPNDANKEEKQEESELKLTRIHVKIYSSKDPNNRKLLAETFGYLKGE